MHRGTVLFWSFLVVPTPAHLLNRRVSLRCMQVVVPMDVVSSRLMVAKAPPANSAAAPAPGAVHSVKSPSMSTPPSTVARSPSPSISPALAKSPDGRSICTSSRVCSGASPVSDAAVRAAHRSGMHMAQHILRTEGVAGLYRCSQGSPHAIAYVSACPHAQQCMRLRVDLRTAGLQIFVAL